MIGHESAATTATNYRRFAEFEARGRSPVYDEWASAVASDVEVLAFLEKLPQSQRQPNLLFAAARLLAGTAKNYTEFRALILDRATELEHVMRTRRTQTNEPGRCASLLPALAELPQPLALLEVGASAGLTLLPDRYNYDYAGHTITSDQAAPVLRCETRGRAPIPKTVPRIVWRAGLDLNPLDITDDEDVAWLRCLVWPDQPERARRLESAIAVARRDPPRVLRGDLVDDIAALAAQAPSTATLVVFHTAVLPYISAQRRADFAATVQEIGAVWLSNEGIRVLDLPDLPAPPPGTDPFVLIRDESRPLAFTESHGAWLHWIG